jgi:hypothetical protein
MRLREKGYVCSWPLKNQKTVSEQGREEGGKRPTRVKLGELMANGGMGPEVCKSEKAPPRMYFEAWKMS